MRLRHVVSLVLVAVLSALPGHAQKSSPWRQATEAELKALLPARATVEKEHIETEMRSASGVTDGRGKFFAGIVLITAGYSADGKYSHFLMTQVPVRIADILFAPGEYVFGWQRGDDLLNVKFYDAGTGVAHGVAQARHIAGPIRVEAFKIYPPQGRSILQIGRFGLAYEIVK